MAFLLWGCQRDYVDTVLNHIPAEDDSEVVMPETTENTLKIGTYNLWVVKNGTGDYVWSNRKDNLAQSIISNDFDFFGIQECDLTIRTELPELLDKLGGDYAWYLPTSQLNQGFVYKTTRLEQVGEPKYFYLSDTPDQKSTCWDGHGRGCVYVEFKDKVTGKKFALMSTHGPLEADEYRVKMADLLNARAAQYANDAFPVFCVGDMNMACTEPGYEQMLKYWKDCYEELDYTKRFGPLGTFNSHKTTTILNDVTRRIDYIFLRDKANTVKLISYVNDITTYNGLYPSDHNPVSVQFEIH